MDAAERVYTANDLNQYTATSDPAEAFDYDADGNLTQDGTFNYTWDAENRLVGMHTGDLASPQANDKWLQFKYDYMGRRVEKTYQVYSGGWQVQSGYPIRVVYDGWNPVLVLKSDNSIKYKLTWGLDVSGTIHGAGGIGGLLAAVETQGTETEADDQRYWFFYDANGNVGQVLDTTNTGNITLAAHYEYDPYGNLIATSGTYAATTPFRFSTKWFDDETHLGYWGYRYYSPRLGRWISRDRIGEAGGLNIQGFVSNSPTLKVDPHGAAAIEDAKSLLENERSRHKGRTYYTLAGVESLFAQLSWVLGQIDVRYYYFSSANSRAGAYNSKTNTLAFARGTTAGDTIVHELIHALDDYNNWHIGPVLTDYEATEALAYGASDHLLNKAALHLAEMDNPKFVRDCKSARFFWNTAWRAFNAFPTQKIEWYNEWGPEFAPGTHSQRFLTAADLWDVNAKLGLRFSCSALKPAYEEMLVRRGIWDTSVGRVLNIPGFPNAVGGPCQCSLTCDFKDFVLDPVLK